MAESIITRTIYKTRQDSRTRIVVCATHHVKWERKKKKKYKMYHVIVLLWFLHNFPVAQAGYCLSVSGCQSDFLTVFLLIPVAQAGFCL